MDTRVEPELAITFCGMPFNTPLVLLSGCVGFGEEYTRVAGFSNRDVGAICLKGTTGQARLGNPPHRIAETPDGMLNAIGLQNPGVEAVCRDILPKLDFSETRFIANVCGSTLEEYVEVATRFDDSPIDAMEINISCPNVKEGGVQFGNVPEMSARVVAAIRKVTKKPLITKMSPNQTDIQENARRCIEAGTDAFAVINTMTGMAIDAESGRAVIGAQIGVLRHPTAELGERHEQNPVRHTESLHVGEKTVDRIAGIGQQARVQVALLHVGIEGVVAKGHVVKAGRQIRRDAGGDLVEI